MEIDCFQLAVIIIYTDNKLLHAVFALPTIVDGTFTYRMPLYILISIIDYPLYGQ